MELSTLKRLSQFSLQPSRCFLRPLWICPACRGPVPSWRRLASSQAQSSTPDGSSSVAQKKKPYYVTTPIFYVNASPHIGHMYTMMLADVLKRWKTLKQEKALLCTGTDEHGMKIQRAAAVNHMEPREFCDANAAVFQDLAQRSVIDNDFFIRTTDEDHKHAVRHFWRELVKRGLIYESKHEGWYCVSDETFYPESLIEKRIDPMTGRVYLASKESGNEVEWVAERTYHFKMTALKDRLLKFYGENPEWVVPASRMAEVVHWVEHNLEDLSVSRPVSRLNWGIRVPSDESQTIYVWLDALVNYLTKAGYPNWAKGNEEDGGWPADVQVIGKDILRFHCVYWPALLLALDLPPPKRILSHAHWTLGRKKMSKSTGNVVDPFLAIDRFGVDTLRFFLLGSGGIQDDADYGNEIIVDRYKKQLQGGVGNLLGRMTRSKRWNVREAVEEAVEEAVYVGEAPPGPSVNAEHFANQREFLKGVPAKVEAHFDQLDPGAALREINELIAETNRFVTATEPWSLARARAQNDKLKSKELALSIYYACESLRIAGILLQPFMPEKATELLEILGVPEGNRTWSHCCIGADHDYGTPLRSAGTSVWDSLFPPLPVES